MTSPDQIAIYTTPDGAAHIRLQLKGGSAWLNTTQKAELFDAGAPAINHHIREILKDRELESSECKELLQHPGQDRRTNHYNLDMILAAGYRVRGPRGAQSRKCAARQAGKLNRGAHLSGVARPSHGDDQTLRSIPCSHRNARHHPARPGG